MGRAIEVKVTSQGIVVPRPMLASWGDVEEVEIEQHGDTIVIRPKPSPAHELRDQIARDMKKNGLVEELPWTQPPVVSSDERARLAQKLSQGRPLSETIIEDRA